MPPYLDEAGQERRGTVLPVPPPSPFGVYRRKNTCFFLFFLKENRLGFINYFMRE